jgi:hypothetical protein
MAFLIPRTALGGFFAILTTQGGKNVGTLEGLLRPGALAPIGLIGGQPQLVAGTSANQQVPGSTVHLGIAPALSRVRAGAGGYTLLLYSPAPSCVSGGQWRSVLWHSNPKDSPH